MLVWTRGKLASPAALKCALVRPLAFNVVPIAHLTLSKSQKRTVEKYGGRSAKSAKNKGDFLDSASKQMKADADKKKSSAPKEVATSLFGPQSREDQSELYEENSTFIDEDENNEIYDFPDFTRAVNRFVEYEQNQEDIKEEEPVTDIILDKERADTIKRLWEPYETEEFSLKTLIGEAKAFEQQGPDVVLEAERPSKILYYPEEDLAKYLPEGFSGSIDKAFSYPSFTKKGIMVRPIVEDIIAWLQQWRDKQFIGRKKPEDFYNLLNGPQGCGKSCLLNPIVHWARLTGWLVCFIPDGKGWAGVPKKGMGVTKSLSYSTINETWFGQPYLASQWIAALLQAHKDKLATLPIRMKFTVRDVDPEKPTFTAEPNKTLMDLLEFGLAHPDQASDCIWYFRKELCAVTEYPVLIVVDAVNAMRGHSFYGDPIDPYIFAPNLDTSRLILTQAFQEYHHHGLANGLYLGSLTLSASMRSMQTKITNLDKQPTKYRLIPGLATTEVPTLSRMEAHVLARWYFENKVFSNTEYIPWQTVDYMWAMSQGNGDVFWKQAEFL